MDTRWDDDLELDFAVDELAIYRYWVLSFLKGVNNSGTEASKQEEFTNLTSICASCQLLTCKYPVQYVVSLSDSTIYIHAYICLQIGY